MIETKPCYSTRWRGKTIRHGWQPIWEGHKSNWFAFQRSRWVCFGRFVLEILHQVRFFFSWVGLLACQLMSWKVGAPTSCSRNRRSMKWGSFWPLVFLFQPRRRKEKQQYVCAKYQRMIDVFVFWYVKANEWNALACFVTGTANVQIGVSPFLTSDG